MLLSPAGPLSVRQQAPVSATVRRVCLDVRLPKQPLLSRMRRVAVVNEATLHTAKSTLGVLKFAVAVRRKKPLCPLKLPEADSGFSFRNLFWGTPKWNKRLCSISSSPCLCARNRNRNLLRFFWNFLLFFFTAWPVFLVPQLRKSFDLDTGSENPNRLDQSHLCSRVSQVEATGSSRVVPTTYKALDMRLPKNPVAP